MKSKKASNISTYILSFLASAIGISLNFFLARVLEAESFGKLQYLIALATTCSQILIFGINSFLIREAHNSKQNHIFSKCFSLFLFLALFIIPIIYFVVYRFCDYTTSNLLLTVVIISISFLMGVDALIGAFYQGTGKYKYTIIFETLIPKGVLFILAIGFCIASRMDLFQEIYLFIYIIIYLIICVPICITLFRKFDIKFAKEDLLSITFFFGVTITYSLGNNLTKVLQGTLFNQPVALGIISVSISIASLIRIITSVLDNIVKPLFAQKKRENDNNGLIELYQFDTRVNSYVSIPLYLFFILFSKNFLLIFGESYTLYPNILVLISITNAVSDLTGPNGTLLAMVGKEKWELYNGILYFALYVVGIFVFSFDEIYGLCFALLLAQVGVNIAKYIEIWVLFKKAPLNAKTLLSMLIIACVNCLLILPLIFINNFWLWLGIGIASGICLVILNFFVFSLYRKKDFKNLLKINIESK